MIDENGYRKNVGIILCNANNKLLVCRRNRENSWQFPQGGFEDHETSENAMYRELYEEIGLKNDDVQILGKTKGWLKYDLPRKYQRKTNNQLCIGQKQIWFLLRLISEDSNINLLSSEKPEFDSWKWVDKDEPLKMVIDFKKNVYTEAISQLIPLIEV